MFNDAKNWNKWKKWKKNCEIVSLSRYSYAAELLEFVHRTYAKIKYAINHKTDSNHRVVLENSGALADQW